jgi:hypothetical protein
MRHIKAYYYLAKEQWRFLKIYIALWHLTWQVNRVARKIEKFEKKQTRFWADIKEQTDKLEESI